MVSINPYVNVSVGVITSTLPTSAIAGNWSISLSVGTSTTMLHDNVSLPYVHCTSNNYNTISLRHTLYVVHVEFT